MNAEVTGKVSQAWFFWIIAIIASFVWVLPPVSCAGYDSNPFICLVPAIFLVGSATAGMLVALLLGLHSMVSSRSIEIVSFERVKEGKKKENKSKFRISFIDNISGKARSITVRSMTKVDLDSIRIRSSLATFFMLSLDSERDMEQLFDAWLPGSARGRITFEAEAHLFDIGNTLILCLAPAVGLPIALECSVDLSKAEVS